MLAIWLVVEYDTSALEISAFTYEAVAASVLVIGFYKFLKS